MKKTRRDFIKKTMLSTAVVSLGGILPGFSAKSYSNILGANERILVGCNGDCHTGSLACPSCYISK